MEVSYSKKFLKQLAGISLETREKMQGYDGFYKVRFGNYRLGLAIENDLVIVKTVMHRKEIYKFFP